MKNEIFEKFAKNIKSSGKLEEYILVASNDAKVVQFRSLITFLRTGYLELASAAQCLKLCSGKSAERIQLLKELKAYLLNFFPVLVDVETVKIYNIYQRLSEILPSMKKILVSKA